MIFIDKDDQNQLNPASARKYMINNLKLIAEGILK